MHLLATAALVSGGFVTLAPPSMAGELTAEPVGVRSAPAGLPQALRPDTPGPAVMRVGGRAKFPDTRGGHAQLAAAFQRGSALAGPWDITRTFHRTLPTRERAITPDGVVEIASYKTPQRNVASYVKSMRPQDMLAWWHEPEGSRDGWEPGAYRAQFVKEYNTAHAANPIVKFGQISGGYQWRAGNRGADGAFLPPKGSVDWLGFDTYRTGTDDKFNAIVPLAKVGEFQAWYKKAQTYDVPLYITEYGRGIVGVPGAAARRAAVIPEDFTYLKSLGFAGMIAWYSDEGPDSRSWRFTDGASIEALRSISRAD